MTVCAHCGAEIRPAESPHFDDSRRQIVVDGERRHVKRVLWNLLSLFRSRIGRTLSQNAIMDHLYSWSTNPPNDTIINVYICQLRPLLRGVPVEIITVHGVGYRMEMQRKQVAAE